jgi:hypothetical protein
MYTEDFKEFWAAWPGHRVGKLDAMKAYTKARKGYASQDELLAGLERYKKNKPAYADWCHPATWLNRGRWMDEYGPSLPPPTPRSVQSVVTPRAVPGVDATREYLRRLKEGA